MNQTINKFTECSIRSTKQTYGFGAMFSISQYVKLYCKRGDKINVVNVLGNETVDTLTPYAQLVVVSCLSWWSNKEVTRLFETTYTDEWRSARICNDTMTRDQLFALLGILLRKYQQNYPKMHFAQYLMNINSLVNVRNFLKIFPNLKPNQRREIITDFITQLKVGVWQDTSSEIIYTSSEPTTIY